MCNRKHLFATLSNGSVPKAPSFPGPLAAVHAQWAKTPRVLSNHFNELSERLGTSEPVTLRFDVKTSDGYEWFAALTFKGEGYVVDVLLPGCESYANKDGTTTDRMSAVYVEGQCDDVSLAALLYNLAAAFAEIAATRRMAA